MTKEYVFFLELLGRHWLGENCRDFLEIFLKAILSEKFSKPAIIGHSRLKIFRQESFAAARAQLVPSDKQLDEVIVYKVASLTLIVEEKFAPLPTSVRWSITNSTFCFINAGFELR